MAESLHPSDMFLLLLKRLCREYWAKGDSGRAQIYRQETIAIPGLNGSEEFSATYSVIDLGVGLQELFQLHDYCPPHILLRQEYKDVKNHIHERQARPECMGAVITGQPGIGKSCFLLYLLVERVLNGEVTAWSTSKDKIYLLLGQDQVGVHIGDARTLDVRAYPGAWALVEPDDHSVIPHHQLTSGYSTFFVVQAAGPEGEKWECWSTKRSARAAVMKPWSWEEIFICGTQLEPYQPISVARLEKAFTMYGPFARQCFLFARDEEMMDEWEQQIPYLLESCRNMVMAASSATLLGRHGRSSFSWPLLYKIFCVVPSDSRFARATLVSAHIAAHVFNVLKEKDPIHLQELCSRLREYVESQEAAEWLERERTSHASRQIEPTLVDANIPPPTARFRAATP